MDNSKFKKILILFLSANIVWLGSIYSQKSDCYCLTIKKNERSIKKKCLKINNNETFEYQWQSKYAHHEGEFFSTISEGVEKGKWNLNIGKVIISSDAQAKDFYIINRSKIIGKVDSVELFIDQNKITNRKINLGQLIKYDNDTIVERMNFGTNGYLKIPLDTVSNYGILKYHSPHQFRFTIESNEIKIDIETIQYSIWARCIIKDEEILIKENQLIWNNFTKNEPWTKVSELKYNEYLK